MTMQEMSERGFSWYGGLDNGGWRFDARLRDPAVRAAQLERAAEERKERCRELLQRRHCSPARKAKLLRRISGGMLGQRPDVQELEGGQLVVRNRHNRRAQVAGK
jgi:hypothetical protein